YGHVPMEGDGGAPALELERAANGDVRSILESLQPSTPTYPFAVLETVRLPGGRVIWEMQLCSGLIHLHSYSFIHCDISSRNLVFAAALDAKLCDFGESATLGGTSDGVEES